MSVLIASDRNRLLSLEERLVSLESRLNEIAPEDPKPVFDWLLRDPLPLLELLVPAIIPLLRKKLTTLQKPLLTVLKNQVTRLNYLSQYFDNLDKGLVELQAQSQGLITRFTQLEQAFSTAIPPAKTTNFNKLAIEQTIAAHQSQLSELAQQINEFQEILSPLSQHWQTQQTQFEQLVNRIDNTLLNQHSQLSELENNYRQLEQVFTKQQKSLLDQLKLSSPLSEVSHKHTTQLANLERHLNNLTELEDAVVRQENKLAEITYHITTLNEAIQPLQQSVQKQQNYATEFEQYFDNLEKAHLNQHWQLTQLTEQVTNWQDRVGPMQESLQLSHSQLSMLEQTLDNLEKAQVEQHLQLSQLTAQVPQWVQQAMSPLQSALQIYKEQFGEIDKYLDNLEKVHVSQHLQLNNLTQEMTTAQQSQIRVQAQLGVLDNLTQAQESRLEQVDKRVMDVEGAKLGQLIEQVKHFEQVAARFEIMEERVNDPQQRTQDLAELLPEAIRQTTQQLASAMTSQMSLNSPLGGHSANENENENKSATGEEKLAESMQRPVEMCIQQAIKKDVRPFADALFPLIGPTIRRSLAEAFRDLLQRINILLGQSIFSSQGIMWRIQAWRTGQSFAEIVLSHTLQYRVEQIFLIHRETGILILHSHSEEANIGDSDAVSGMFTAIQDFVRDSFSASKEEELDSVEVGRYTVWVERGPYVVLACVIRGDAPRHFRNLMREQLEIIHSRHGPLLEQFDGDNTKLKYCQPLLEEMLRVELKSEAQPHWMTPQLATILGMIVVASGIWLFQHVSYKQQLNDYLERLRHTPGIVITSIQEEGGNLLIYGLKDPLAEEPTQIAKEFSWLATKVIFIGKPYQDLEPPLLEKRLRQWLKPPTTVTMQLEGKILHLQGHADQAWINQINDRIWQLAGIVEIVSDNLVNTEAQFHAYLKVLRETPGIMLVSNNVKEGNFLVTGMRDPDSEDPALIAEKMQITNVVGTWRPYQDLGPIFVERRVLKRLTPPKTVTVKLQNDILKFSGHASREWITKAIDSARTVPGINRLDADELIDTDQFLLEAANLKISAATNSNYQVTLGVSHGILQVKGRVNSVTFQTLQQQLTQFQSEQPELVKIEMNGLIDAEGEFNKLKQSVENTVVYFAEGTDLMEKQTEVLESLLKELPQLVTYSHDLSQSIQLKIIGNTDGLGTELYNRQLGQQRGETVRDWLQQRGIDKNYLLIGLPATINYGKSQIHPEDRNVMFKVILTREQGKN